jgi:hypothetical protein
MNNEDPFLKLIKNKEDKKMKQYREALLWGKIRSGDI